MIRSFRHKGLAALFEHDETSGVRADLVERCRTSLGALQHARSLTATQTFPVWRLHSLHGRPKRHAIAVNGPWRITLEWHDGEAWRVDLEWYHQQADFDLWQADRVLRDELALIEPAPHDQAA